jgi:hypothetical protein
MSADAGLAADTMGIGARTGVGDGGREQGSFFVQKWDDDATGWVHRKLGLPAFINLSARQFLRLKVQPWEELLIENCNLITAAGWGVALNSANFGPGSAPGTKFDATHGRIGVGTGTGAAAYNDTTVTITSMTGNNWNLCGAGPTYNAEVSTGGGATLVFTASFGATDAVGAWNEFAVDQGTAAAASGSSTAPMINHATSIGAGTKAGGTWSATATLKFT